MLSIRNGFGEITHFMILLIFYFQHLNHQTTLLLNIIDFNFFSPLLIFKNFFWTLTLVNKFFLEVKKSTEIKIDKNYKANSLFAFNHYNVIAELSFNGGIREYWFIYC